MLIGESVCTPSLSRVSIESAQLDVELAHGRVRSQTDTADRNAVVPCIRAGSMAAFEDAVELEAEAVSDRGLTETWIGVDRDCASRMASALPVAVDDFP